MRVLGLLAFFATGVLAQVGTPLFTTLGPLSCGLKLYAPDPGSVQTYCLLFSPPLPIRTLCNSLNEITPATPGQSLPVAASQSCFASDVAGGNVYEVTWLVWQPIAALPPGSTGTIVYQIAATQQPCTVNTFGQCVANGLPATTTTQSGSFSSGVLAAGLTTWQTTDGAPPVNVDTEPGPHWVAGYGGGISVFYNDAMAQASWLGGACRVTSTTPGTAQFVRAADDSVKVGWIPDGWCSARIDLSTAPQPELTGACSPLGLTARFNTVESCSATPDEAVRQAVNAHLLQWVQTPIVQGQ